MEKALRKHLPGGKFKGVSRKRSRAMSAVKGRGNKTTELRLRLALVRTGISGWKLRPHNTFGSPDFIFPDSELVVFVDGCFWHGCPKCGHFPKSNAAFWKAKIERNRQRDRETTLRFRAERFTVLRLWENELSENIEGCIDQLREALKDRASA